MSYGVQSVLNSFDFGVICSFVFVLGPIVMGDGTGAVISGQVKRAN